MQHIFGVQSDRDVALHEIRRRAWLAKRDGGPFRMSLYTLHSFLKPSMSNWLLYLMLLVLISGSPLLHGRWTGWSEVWWSLLPVAGGLIATSILIGFLGWHFMESRYNRGPSGE